MPTTWTPQPGPQSMFLASSADITIYGGAAGGGKSWALLADDLYHIKNPRYASLTFRRTVPQITNPGGLWDEASQMFPLVGGKPNQSALTWKFPSGATVKLSHMQYEADRHQFQGAQIACCEVDTPLLMADGTHRRVDMVHAGDFVQTLEGPRRVLWASEPRREQCILARTYNTDGTVRGEQVHAYNHAVLTPIGWRSFSDVLDSFPSFAALTPTQSRFFRTNEPQSPLKSRAHAQSRDSQLSGQVLAGQSFRRSSGRRSLSETFVDRAGANQDSAYESYRESSGGVRTPSLVLRFPVMLHELPPQSARISVDRHGAGSNVGFVSAPQGSPVDCCDDPRLDDGRVLPTQESGPVPLPLRVDAARRSPMGCSGDDQERARKRSRRPTPYSHPYSSETRSASHVALAAGTCEATPCGERWVIDLQVEEVAHYLTVSGLTNQNCIKFDELTHFSETMFFYMLSRNRSTSGVRPYMRATCNADADSWVADLIAWWIDQDTGFPIPERAGVHRWFVRDGGVMRWADRAKDLPWVEVEVDGEMIPQPPKSVTFIPAKVTDNKVLLSKDPGYLASLLALPMVDRARLLEGNWKIRDVAGNYFKRDWFEIVDAAPADAERVRDWDFAATEVTKPGQDPDWTAGALVSRTREGIWYIEDMQRVRATPAGVQRLVRQTAELDGRQVPIHLEQEPGSSGKIAVDYYIRDVLTGFTAYPQKPQSNKRERAKPVSSQAEAGNVKLVRGEWNAAFLAEAEMFPDGAHDDQIDAVSGAFAVLSEGNLPYAYLRNDPEFRAEVLTTDADLTEDERIERRIAAFHAAQGL